MLQMSKNPLLIGHVRRELLLKIRYTGLPVVKVRMKITV
jgi:hypothetical protein